MPLSHRAFGRPGSQVIPNAWGPDHAQVVETTFYDSVEIFRPDQAPEWDAAQGRTVTSLGTPIYVGKCEITARAGGGTSQRLVDAAEERVPLSDYEVKLPRPVANTAAGLVVRVVESLDPALIGRTLTVAGVERATERFSRVLGANLQH